MSRKNERIASEIVAAVAAWNGVRGIMLADNAAAADPLDPYCFLSFDVYHDAPLPHAERRQESLGPAGAFETNPKGTKDRFLFGDTPVRLEYRPCRIFDEWAASGGRLLQDSGTYCLHRLSRGAVLYQKDAWIDGLRSRLDDIPQSFWDNRREESQLQMEHFLNDMEAASLHRDRFFFALAHAGYLARMAGTLFAVNRRFEPGHRLIVPELLALPILPEAFEGSLDLLLALGSDSMDRNAELASLLTRRIVAL